MARRTREEALAARRMMDAVRELFGYAPLYRGQRHETQSWITDTSVGYYELRAASAQRNARE